MYGSETRNITKVAKTRAVSVVAEMWFLRLVQKREETGIKNNIELIRTVRNRAERKSKVVDETINSK